MKSRIGKLFRLEFIASGNRSSMAGPVELIVRFCDDLRWVMQYRRDEFELADQVEFQ